MTKTQLKTLVEKWAAERATDDLKFVGDAPFKGMTPDKVAESKHALIDYAKRGASEALNALSRHGYLNNE